MVNDQKQLIFKLTKHALDSFDGFAYFFQCVFAV